MQLDWDAPMWWGTGTCDHGSCAPCCSSRCIYCGLCAFACFGIRVNPQHREDAEIHNDVCILSVMGTAARLRNISAYTMRSSNAYRRGLTQATPIQRTVSPRMTGQEPGSVPFAPPGTGNSGGLPDTGRGDAPGTAPGKSPAAGKEG